MTAAQALKGRSSSASSPNFLQRYRWSEVAKLVIDPPHSMHGARQKFKSVATAQRRVGVEASYSKGEEEETERDEDEEASLSAGDFEGEDGQRQLKRHINSLRTQSHLEKLQLQKLQASLIAAEAEEQRLVRKMDYQRQLLEEHRVKAEAMESKMTKLQAIEEEHYYTKFQPRRSWEPPPAIVLPSKKAKGVRVAEWSPVDMRGLARNSSGSAGALADAIDADGEAMLLRDLSHSAQQPGLGLSASMPQLGLPEEGEDGKESINPLEQSRDEAALWLEGHLLRDSHEEKEDSFEDSDAETSSSLASSSAQPRIGRAVSGVRSKSGIIMVNGPPSFPVYAPLGPTASVLREGLRAAMLRAAGNPRKAFKVLDASGSGNVSMTEFEGGLRELGIQWQELTGFKTVRHVFRLFDSNRCGLLDYRKLFGQDELAAPRKPNTPGFWQSWCQDNKDISEVANGVSNLRSPKWQTEGPDHELKLLFEARSSNEEAMVRRAWMRSTIRRLKHRGKSDARCREVVAAHLPRGTGPKDLDDVRTFSEVEVRACKRAYQDQVQEPVRNIQKVIYDMKEQRRLLQTSRQKLFTVAIEPHKKREAQEEAKELGRALMGMGTLSKNQQQAEASEASRPDPATQEREMLRLQKEQRTAAERQLAQKLRIKEDQITDVHQQFCRVSGESTNLDDERIGFKQLRDVLRALRCDLVQPFTEADLERYWGELSGHHGDSSTPLTPMRSEKTVSFGGQNQVQPTLSSNKRVMIPPRASPTSQQQTCNFETFASWFVETDFFKYSTSRF